MYEGDHKDGKMSGKGMYKWPDGAMYEGTWANNMRNGYGIYHWDEGKYEGSWLSDMKISTCGRCNATSVSAATTSG